MKILYIIRHAKSSWANPGQSDFERPLNERGMKDAPDMAFRLKSANQKIEKFISSPALRARQTCEMFCSVYAEPLSSISFVDQLYHAPASVAYDVVEKTEDSYDSAALFFHNPGITDFVNSLNTGVTIDNMPTCAVFAVKAMCNSWKEFQKAEKQFLFFDYPKNQQSSFSK